MKQTLLELLQSMKSMPEAEPQESFRANARTRILNSVVVQPASSSWIHRMNMPYHIGRWVGGFALASALFGSTVVYAAQYSKPGGALYGVKTASEQAALRLAPTIRLKTSVATTVIDRRAEEVNEEQIHGTAQDIDDAVASFQNAARSLENTKGVDVREVETHVREAERDMESSDEESPRSPTTQEGEIRTISPTAGAIPESTDSVKNEVENVNGVQTTSELHPTEKREDGLSKTE